jgi:phosphoribosylanthranilate isomerase
MTWVKICGTTNLEDARLAVEAGADALGFVFAPSPRRITPEQAREIVVQLPATIEKVGVFVNESPARIRDIVSMVGLTMAQLHGDEDVEFAGALATSKNGAGALHVIKAVPVQGGFGARMRTFAQHGHVHAVLLDSASALRGGSGQAWDWRSVSEFMPRRRNEALRIILAGGLNPENVADAIRVLRPWGVDVVSGVEREPGRKDPVKLKAFITAVRESEGRP